MSCVYLSWRRLFVVGALLLGAAATQVAGAARGWSPAVGGALQAYHAGRYDEAQALCLRILNDPDAAAAQRDAAVVQALCMLRRPARADRLDGRARLAQLAGEDATLADEPECNLAYGIAQRELSETAAALAMLERAAAGFAAQGQTSRQLAALVELARTWARHTEWEVTPAQFNVRRPTSRAAADEIRRMQIAALRARIAAVADHAEALASIDLEWARHLIASPATADEGYALLEQLATAPTLAAPNAAAAMLLAEHCEETDQGDRALELYKRIRVEARGEVVTRAEERTQRLTQPELIVDVPASVPSSGRAAVHIRARGLESVELEMRQVDLDAWLVTSQHRGSEALLPESGSVQLAREWDTRGTRAYVWWDSDTHDSPPEFEAPPGAYVVVTRGRDAEGREHMLKRLVVVTDLVATCIIGPRSVAVWAAFDRLQTGPTAGTGTVKFWMRRSFTPVEAALESGVARFALPSEARVMRDKDWICLVRLGEHVAVCRGRLPRDVPGAEGTPAVLLVGGPPAPRVGESLYLSGLLLDAGGRTRWGFAGERIELQIVDALERVDLRREVEVSSGGAFAAEIPITPDLCGQHLRIVPRRGGQVLENIAGRLAVQVQPAGETLCRVRCDVPRWLPEATPLLGGRVEVEPAWGQWPAGTQIGCQFHALQLPTTESHRGLAVGTPIVRGGPPDEANGYTFSVSASPREFGLSGGPLAVVMDAGIAAWAGWQGAGHAEVLLGAERPHVWLAHQPPEPYAGQAVRFNVGWFEPGGLAVSELPDVEVRRREELVARLHLYPGPDGPSSESWTPVQAGSYEVTTTLPVVDGSPVRLSKTVEVKPAAGGPAATDEGVRCRAHFTHSDGRLGIRVSLAGAVPGPLLVLAEAGDPLAGVGLERLAGATELIVPLDGKPSAGTRVVFLGARGDRVQVIAVENVTADPERRLELELAATTDEIWPGTTVTVDAICGPAEFVPDGATLIARLISAADIGFATGQPESRSDVSSGPVPGLALVTSTGGEVGRAMGATNRAQASAQGAESSVWGPLFEGTTLWSTSLGAGTGQVRLAVPVPPVPGLYKLGVLLRAPDGGRAVGAVILDARKGVRVRLDAPERLTVGDRTTLAVLVENDGDEQVAAQIAVHGGDGLHVESLRLAAPKSATRACPPDVPVVATLPAGGHAWLYADVEAARVGRGVVRVELAARAVCQTISSAYEVLPEAQEVTGDWGMTIERELFVWTPIGQPEPMTSERVLENLAVVDKWEAADPLGDRGNRRRQEWRTEPLSSASRLTVGQMVQVREEFTLDRARVGFTWSQAVPPTCAAVADDVHESRPVGLRAAGPGAGLTFNVPELRPGVHVHEYFLAVVRPGVAVLPDPVLRTGETRIPVTVGPEEPRLIVLGGK